MKKRIREELDVLNAVYGRGRITSVVLGPVPAEGRVSGTVECKLQYGTCKYKVSVTAWYGQVTIKYRGHQKTIKDTQR